MNELAQLVFPDSQFSLKSVYTDTVIGAKENDKVTFGQKVLSYADKYGKFSI